MIGTDPPIYFSPKISLEELQQIELVQSRQRNVLPKVKQVEKIKYPLIKLDEDAW